jgi:anti-sigma factor RsiW
MHSQEQHARTPSALDHPAAAEWMGFLYGELPPEQRRALGAHLARCDACAAQIKDWRVGLEALDQWQLPPPAPAASRPRWAPVLRWAAAALLIVGLGFVLGRQTSPPMKELAALRTAVAELAQKIDAGNDPAEDAEAAIATARSETLRLLAEYARLQEAQRATDQQALKLGLQTLDARLASLRAELETVAVNTEDGFQQTRQNLTRLVSFSVAAPDTQ